MTLSLSKILWLAWLACLALLAQGEVFLLDEKADAKGHYAFGYGGQPHDDITLPNPRFFEELEKRIRREPGLRIVLRESPLLQRAGVERARELGRYLGRRFVKRKKFYFVAPEEKSAELRALIDGIREYDSVHWMKE